MIKKRHVISIILVCGIFLSLKGCWFFFPKVFQTLELQAQDGLIRLVYHLGHAPEPTPDIVYIDLDDSSLNQIPYSKNDPELYSKVVTILKKAGVAGQLIDMVFTSGNGTSALASSISEAGNVYLPLVFSDSKSDIHSPEMVQTIPWPLTAPSPVFPHGQLTITNTQALNTGVAGLGHINCWPDHDGVYRRMPLFFGTDGGLVPTLSLALAADVLGVEADQISISNNAATLSGATFRDGRVIDIKIPFDEYGKTRIPFIGPWPYTYAHYSVALLLEKSQSPEGIMELRDELEHTLTVFSDVTTGGRDFGPVPFSSYSPLSGLHAQFLGGILTDTFFVDANPAQVLLAELLLVGVIMILALKTMGYRLFFSSCTIIAALFGATYLLFVMYHIIFPVVLPTVLTLLATIVILLTQLAAIQQEKRVMKARLMPYFAPSVMEKILASPELLSTVSKKELTILFSDIAGFTEWSSSREASDIHDALNRYFREMSEIVFAHEGTIDKFMGDGLLAFFGDPTPHPDHAKRAVRTALAMQQKAWELKKEWGLTGGMRIRIRIGVHTGEVVVGNMGSEERMDYTVIGSHVNLAQRLESNCAPDRVLISGETLKHLGEDFVTSANGHIEAKGFADPIEVHYVDRYQPLQSHTI